MRPTPLHALHTFESAARHQSYSLAADELHVTHSAVSQQIRILEEALGVRLFGRQGRQMLLTKEGALLYKRIQPALKQIDRATAEVGALQRSPSITVTTLTSFANRWLLPRLARFQKRRPDIAVHIRASEELKDMERAEVDVAIRYGRGTWKGCNAEKLLDEWLFPVCSPAFNKGRLPGTIKSLKRYRVLRDDCREMRDGSSVEWKTWLQQAGIDSADLMHETSYSDANLMLESAIAGQGIAIGRSALVSADMAAGRLVRVFDVIAPAPYSYYIVTAASRKMSAEVQAFVQWLQQEAALYGRKELKSLGFDRA